MRRPGRAKRMIMTMRMNWKQGIFYVRKFGIRKTWAKVAGRFDSKGIGDYKKWIASNEADIMKTSPLDYNPKFSVIVPVYNVLDKHLIPCIESVLGQTYKNFELCIADDNSTWDNVRQTLRKFEDDPRVKIVYRETNGHISACTNSAIELATGDYIALLDCDDTLSPNALYEAAKAVNDNPSADFIYSDEDKIDDDGTERYLPYFKPDWSPDLLMSNMYTCHLGIYRLDIVRQIGGFTKGLEGSQDYDFTLRFIEAIPWENIVHIPRILYHWRERSESTAINPESKPYILESAKNAKADSLARRGIDADIDLIDIMYQWRVIYKPKGDLVSIIISSSGDSDSLRRMLESLKNNTDYNSFEIIVSGEAEEESIIADLARSHGGTYVRNEGSHNLARLRNAGAGVAQGKLLLFLDDKVTVKDSGWLSILAGQAGLDYEGAVGARLVSSDSKTILHSGIISGSNGPRYAFARTKSGNIGYFGHNIIDLNRLAVSGACLMVSKAKYDECGGFDESYTGALTEVDFCMKLCEKGYYNCVRNDVSLECSSMPLLVYPQANDAETALANETRGLYDKHSVYKSRDPFYNDNLDRLNCDYTLETGLT